MATHHRPQYSSKTAAETLQWMNAIADFIRRYKPLMDSHVVNFFKDRLWELVDEQWIECLRKEPVENLLRIPSGFVQDYWPASLQDFILKLRSLALPRERKSSHVVLPNLHVAPLGSVLAQGMNSKKKHEVEIMAAVVKAIAHGLNAHTVIDVGSGQGYLAQALSFEYQLSVIAIDASMHHSSVTAARAERIKKHYAAKLIKSDCENLYLKVPQVVTCHVLSSDTLTALSTSSCKHSVEQIDSASDKCDTVSSLVLASLHACGDLSVSMIRTFVNCDNTLKFLDFTTSATTTTALVSDKESLSNETMVGRVGTTICSEAISEDDEMADADQARNSEASALEMTLSETNTNPNTLEEGTILDPVPIDLMTEQADVVANEPDVADATVVVHSQLTLGKVTEISEPKTIENVQEEGDLIVESISVDSTAQQEEFVPEDPNCAIGETELKDGSPMDASWVDIDEIRAKFPSFELGDKLIF